MVCRRGWVHFSVAALVGGLCSVSACASDDVTSPGATGSTGDACAPATAQIDGGASTDGATTEAPTGGGALGGKLLVLGGAVADTSPIWERVITEGGGKTGIHFLVVTAATAASASSFASYQDILVRRNGIAADSVRQLHVGDQDDPTTTTVDESIWRDGADTDAEIASVRDWASVVWFADGDAAHIMSTFVKADGSDRGVTKAIRDKLASKTIIVAGTSAGAAIMSNPMIGGGDPFQSWLYPPLYAQLGSVPNPNGAVMLNQGLGFLGAVSNVLVDTHWFQQARLARTLRAVDFASTVPQPGFPNGLNPKMKVGLGIGENTGFLVDVATGTGEVVGEPDASWVAVLDMNGATTNGTSNPYAGANIRVGYLGVRDKLTLPTDASPSGTFLPEASKTTYAPCNGARAVAPITGDMFVSGAYVSALQNVLEGTLDATSACHAEGFGIRLSGGSSYNGSPFQVRGFFFRFTTDAKTAEHRSSALGGEIENVIMRFGTGTGTYTPPF